MQVKLKLFIGNKQTEINQSFEVFMQTVSFAFGGKKGSGVSPTERVVTPKTKEEALSAFTQMFGSKPGYNKG